MQRDDSNFGVKGALYLLDEMRRLNQLLGISVNDSVKAAQISLDASQAIGQEINRLNTAIENLRSLLKEANGTSIGDQEFWSGARKIYADGSVVWNKLGELLNVSNVEMIFESRFREAPGSWLNLDTNQDLDWPSLVDNDERIGKSGLSEWGTAKDAQTAFRLAQTALGTQDKSLFYAHFIKKSRQSEIANNIGASQAAISARLSRLADRLAMLVGIEKIREQMESENYREPLSIIKASGRGFEEIGSSALAYSGRRNHVDLLIHMGTTPQPIRLQLRLLILPSNRGETVKPSTIQTWETDIKDHVRRNFWNKAFMDGFNDAVSVGIYRRRRASIAYYPAETFLTNAMVDLKAKPSEFFEVVPSAKSFEELEHDMGLVTSDQREEAEKIAGVLSGQETDTWKNS